MVIFPFNKNKGFTLVEALVAITILTLALGGPMALATRSIKDSLASRNKVVAFYLAHEAIEYVKNKRDSNFLFNRKEWRISPVGPKIHWLDGTDVSGGAYPAYKNDLDDCYSSNCRVDVINDNVCNLSNPSCDESLYLNGANYTHNSSGTKTIFTRTVSIDASLNGGNEAEITVTVSWEDYGNRTVTLTQNMFNLAP